MFLEWLFKHQMFLEWRCDTAANLLWITAGPGCEKSALSKTLVDEGLLLSPDSPDNKAASICYFFFKDDVERGSGVNALTATMAYCTCCKTVQD